MARTEWRDIASVPKERNVIVTNAAHPSWQTFGFMRRTDNYTKDPAHDWRLWTLDRRHPPTHWCEAPEPIRARP